MAKTFAVSEDVRDVLRRSTITDKTLKLPEGQLKKELYLAVNKVLESVGGEWNRKAKVHVFDRDPREALGLAVETGKAVNVQQTLQAFYTPAWLADRVVALASVEDDHLVLEPSAGEGALAHAVWRRAPNAVVHLIDIDPIALGRLEKECRSQRTAFQISDFLASTPRQIYDRVVMNPPFSRGQDVAHVTHALKFLKTDGELVAIMPSSIRTRSRLKTDQEFQKLLEQCSDLIEDVEGSAFEEEGTNVATVLVHLVKK